MAEADHPHEGVIHGRTRRRVQARLDAVVTDNRVTVAVVFPVVGAGLLTASAAGLLPTWLAFNPLAILLGTLVMRLPLAGALAPLLDRRAVGALLTLAAYAYAVEFVGVHTGLPYGEFVYGVALGPMLGGEVPLGLPVFFLPLVLNAYLLCLLLLGHRADSTLRRLPAVVAAVLAIDLVLDPAAVALGFWSYAAGGAYYGVALSNFAGWLLSATVAALVVDWGFDRAALRERLRRCPYALDDLVSFVLLWGGVNLAAGNWVPLGVALCFVGALVHVGRFDVARGGESPRETDERA